MIVSEIYSYSGRTIVVTLSHHTHLFWLQIFWFIVLYFLPLHLIIRGTNLAGDRCCLHLPSDCSTQQDIGIAIAVGGNISLCQVF